MGEKKKKEGKEKQLDKMTAKELREVASTIPEIVGVHVMNKPELISAIKKSKGIVEVVKKSDSTVREIKKKIIQLKDLKEKAQKDKDKDKMRIYRRRISRLKKKTRKAA